MPKSFSEAERTYIRERLMKEAEDCLAAYGIRKTTVDELVRRVKIPKGTFYLFYESKEALIFDVILKYNAEIQEKLIGQIAAMRKKPDAEELTEILFGLYRSLDGSFLLKLVGTGELEFFMQKAPPEFIRTNALDDELMVGRLMALVPEADAEKSALYSAALRGAFLLLLNKKEIAYDRFDDMLRMIVRGIVLQMFGE
jgi:AcrR family transcriptional regulator